MYSFSFLEVLSLYVAAISDLAAIKALCEIRTMDFNNLESQLLEQSQLSLINKNNR